MKRTLFSYFKRLDPEPEPKTKKQEESKVTDLNYNVEDGELDTCGSSERPTADAVSDSPDAMLSDQCAAFNKDNLNFFKNDIGVIAANLMKVANSDEILQICDNSWIPPPKFNFPKSTTRNLSFQRQWLDEFSWLAYSAKENGVYCKYCVAFGVKAGGKGDVSLGKLVTKPFGTWKKAKDTFRHHEQLDYHKKSIFSIERLRDIQIGKSTSIDAQIDHQKKKTERENYERLVPIVSAILLCGRQGMALRGHQDDGSFYPDNPSTEDNGNKKYSNEGNFRAILRYRAMGDETLKNNLLSAPKNATYLSKTTQNAIIETSHVLIRKKIVDKVNLAKGFSILADETTDISCMEQLSICIRYLDKELNICEDFLGFIPVTDVSGKALAGSIKNYLYDTIDCSFIYGQGYDGAPAMSGEFNGAQAHLKKCFPMAIYVHCAAHSFSLAINAAFFNWPKRQNVLKREISKMPNKNERRKEKLMSICPTRWAQSHEAVSTYVELQPAVIDALEIIQTWKDRETSKNASQLLTAILTIEFQMSCYIMESINSVILPLSRELQLKNQDLGEISKLSDDALDNFKDKRNNADSCFHVIYENVAGICSEYEIEMKMPRQCSRQKNRCNVGTQNVEDYYRIAFYIPFIDTYISHLQTRFEQHKSLFQSFGQLFPKYKFEENKCTDLYDFYQGVLNCSEGNFISEIKMWRQRICDLNIQNAVEALSVINEKTFENVNTILRVLAVLLVTTATPERSFSTLRRLKTYLRNTMGQERLNGLASLNINHQIDLTEDEILQTFFQNSRKLQHTSK